MKEQLKDVARPLCDAVPHLALAVAIVGRIGLAVMDGPERFPTTISAADVPILGVVLHPLTGSALVAFMYAASLAMVVSTAGVALHGLLFARRRSGGAGRPATARFCGAGRRRLAIVCLLITASGILSGRRWSVHELRSCPPCRCSCWRLVGSRRFSARFWAQRP